MEIDVLFREVYGVCRYYPTNHLGKFMCDMMKKKTFNTNHLKKFSEFGWKINIKYHEKQDEKLCH